MKRYRVNRMYVSGILQNGADGMMEMTDCLIENINGEWVRYWDYLAESNILKCDCELRIKKLKDEINKLKIDKGYKEEDQCNCKEMAFSPLPINPVFPHEIQERSFWICPKHGYKKR